MVSSTSSVRAWMPSARLWVAGPAALSMMQVRMPRASSCAASVSPVGPAPTTRTWQSADDVFVVMQTTVGAAALESSEELRSATYFAAVSACRASSDPGGQPGSGAEPELAGCGRRGPRPCAPKGTGCRDLAIGQAASPPDPRPPLTRGSARRVGPAVRFLGCLVEAQRDRLSERQPATLVNELRAAGPSVRAPAPARRPAPLAAPGAVGLVDLFIGRGGSDEPERGPRAPLPRPPAPRGRQPDRNGEPIPDVQDSRHTRASAARAPGRSPSSRRDTPSNCWTRPRRRAARTQRTAPRSARTARSRAPLTRACAATPANHSPAARVASSPHRSAGRSPARCRLARGHRVAGDQLARPR